MPLVADDTVIARLLTLAMSAGAGAVVTLVAFRTRFALIDAGTATQKREFTEWEKRLDDRLSGMERRQMMTLRIMADIAKKVGVDGRFSDTLVRFLADEANGSGGVDD